MNILIVEDSRNRIKKFYSLFGQHQITSVNFAEGAIENLKFQAFDLILMDYDLREGQTKADGLIRFWVENESETFYFKQKREKPVVVIHSLNTTGAESMANQLNKLAIVVHRIEFFDLLKIEPAELEKILKIEIGKRITY